jgi:hypothetical protein
VRRVLACIAALGVCGALGTGCSSSGKNGTATIAGPKVACSLISQLDRTGAAVERADVKDPAAFDRALEDSVKQYVAVLDDLHDAVPRDLRDDVEHLRAAVAQYRFNDGVDARAAIDAYAHRTCT